MIAIFGIYAYDKNESGGFTVYTIDPFSQKWFEVKQFPTEDCARSYAESKNNTYEDWMR